MGHLAVEIDGIVDRNYEITSQTFLEETQNEGV